LLLPRPWLQRNADFSSPQEEEKEQSGSEGAGSSDSEPENSAQEDILVPPAEVVVHGVGTPRDLADAVADVGATWRRAKDQALQAAGAAKRGFRRVESDGEWGAFVERVKDGRALPVLRKFFNYHGSSCNLEQEVWFRDKANPYATKNPLKEYTILHVHHHGPVAPPLPDVSTEPGASTCQPALLP
jgi:hypothetical protein